MKLRQVRIGTCGADGELAVISEDGASIALRRAASCLIEPEAGDVVLISDGGDGRPYILAVLERSGGGDAERAPTVLSCPGQLTLRADDIRLEAGKVSIAAQAVNLAARTFHSITSLYKRIARFEESVAMTRVMKTGTEAVQVDNIANHEFGMHTQRVNGPMSQQADAMFVKVHSDIRIDCKRHTVG